MSETEEQFWRQNAELAKLDPEMARAFAEAWLLTQELERVLGNSTEPVQ